MLNPETVMSFIRWVLGLPEPQAQLIPVKDENQQRHCKQGPE